MCLSWMPHWLPELFTVRSNWQTDGRAESFILKFTLVRSPSSISLLWVLTDDIRRCPWWSNDFACYMDNELPPSWVSLAPHRRRTSRVSARKWRWTNPTRDKPGRRIEKCYWALHELHLKMSFSLFSLLTTRHHLLLIIFNTPKKFPLFCINCTFIVITPYRYIIFFQPLGNCQAFSGERLHGRADHCLELREGTKEFICSEFPDRKDKQAPTLVDTVSSSFFVWLL